MQVADAYSYGFLLPPSRPRMWIMGESVNRRGTERADERSQAVGIMKRWSAAGRHAFAARGWSIAVALCAVAGNVAAESALVAGGAGSAVAHVSFQIVIPSVVWVDTARGIVYSNDRKNIVRLGSMDAMARPAEGFRGDAPVSARAAGCALVAAAPAPRFANGTNPVRTAGAKVTAAGLYRLSHAETGCVLAAP